MLKKRFLSILLIAAMLVTLMPLGVSAAEETVDGTKYTSVSTAAQLYSALAAGGNILLKNDIALDSSFANTVAVQPGTVLNGNGYCLSYSGSRNVPLFSYATGTVVGQTPTYIKNISFGTNASPMKLKGSSSLFVEESADTSYVIYQNVTFYVQGSSIGGGAVGALYASMKGVTSFFGCTLNVDLSSNVAENLCGGWIGSIDGGDLVMTDCTTIGTITGGGLCTAGIVGQSGGSGNARFTNCINLANITGAQLTGGMVGNVGTGTLSMYFTACKNYGTITSRASDYNGAAGGIIARSSNINDQGNKRLRVFYDCVNYGTILSGARAGGILGTSHDWDTSGKTSCYSHYTFGNCINYGSVSGNAYAGGIMGIASPATYRAEITDCVNLGKITSTKGYAGNFAGMLCTGVITGGYAAGVVSTKQGSDVLVPCVSGNYIMQEGRFQGEKWAISAPTASGVTYIGPAETVASGITKVTNDKLSAALKDLSALCATPMIAADADDADSYVVAAAPSLRGLQQSVQVTNGHVSLRLAAGLNAYRAYREVGFQTTVYVNGKKTEKMQKADGTYLALNVVLANGTASRMEASQAASRYLSTVVIENIPIGKNAVIEVTPYAIAKDGTRYEGKTRVVSGKNCMYRIEPMMLNNILLEDYAIIYAKNDTMSEALLAQRMSDEIAKLTGISIPVLSDAQSCTKSARILIGKTAQTSGTVTGRTIRTQAIPSTIVISGTNTTELSESIEYFIETIEKKMLAGENTWEFASSVTVPVDDELTLMAFNMGAKDNADIKKAEWDLIVDYLPDIWTSQEPWAGFLDDFLNDYAVKPTVKFEEDPSDDDVMKSDVNNKCFTGSGYYGVYWGLPRWVPGDANTNGKASYSVILYAKDRFTPDLSRSGTFWLSEKVNTSGSTYSGSNFPRCATYLTLTDNNTGKTFTVVNVHLDFVAPVQIAQVTILLRELKARVGTDMPIFVTGDMNSTANSNPIALYKDNDVMSMTAMDEMAERAYRQWRNIDWFFTNHPEQIEVPHYNNCSEHTFLNKLWNSAMIMGMPSDHPAIYTEFKFH